MSEVTLYHNPRCSKSRQTLALLEERGIEPDVIEYLKTPPDAATITGLLDKLGIGVETLTRGRDAEILVASRPLTESGRARLEREVRGVYDLFVSRVSEGRSLSPARVDAVGRGRVWTGAQGLERGLVDELGGLRAAVRVAKRALGLAEDADVVLIPHPSPRSLADELADALRASVVRAALPPDWPPLVESFQALVAALPRGAPVLVPPLVLHIR